MSRVLITGASRGIGNAIARKLLLQGREVIGTSRYPDSISITDPAFTAIRLDLTEISEDSQALHDFTEQCPHAHALVLNAGLGRFGGLEEFSHAQIEQLLTINLVAQIQLVRAFIPIFKRRGAGDIVFIGSQSGLSAGKQGTVYSAAKFGLRGFCQALRQECAARNIRVGVINPGMVSSHFFDELGFQPGPDKANSILPEQVADAVSLMLNSDANVVYDEINLSPVKKVVVKKES